MDALVIHTLRSRYRLQGGAPDAVRERLAHVLGEVLDEGLEAALAHTALPLDEHICVRRARAPVHLSSGQSDARLALDWSLALAAAIESSIASGGPEVVRYRSRRHALIDFAMGVAARDLSRAWAWRQLGLLPAGGVSTLAPAESALIEALEGDGAAIVPLLMALAGRAHLEILTARWTAPDWRRLARAALATHGLPTQLADGNSAKGAQMPAGAAAPELSTPLAARLQRTLERSPVAQLLDAPAPEQLRARAVIVLLAGDPALLRAAGGGADALVLSVLQRPADMHDQVSARQAAQRSDGRSLRRERAGRASDRATGTPASSEQAQEAGAVDTSKSRRDADRADTAEDSGLAATTDRQTPRRRAQPAAQTPEAFAEQGDLAVPNAALDGEAPHTVEPGEGADALTGYPPEDLRKRGHTQWGGLLFLLWLIEPAAVQDVAAERPLEGRALRWVLHQLALHLVPAAPDDPAALAFAGLPPGAPPPALEEPHATTDEQAAIDDCADRMIAALRARLDTTEGTDAQLLRQVCERRGEIVADPGWIELHLAADQVSTSIRRCGLDLDPDFLPWLGVVVRFVYG